MNEYIIDTEFIRASKERVHFLEVALYEPQSEVVHDYHFDVHLNSWEKKYFHRAVNGFYGIRTQIVFNAVNDLYNGVFDQHKMKQMCSQIGCAYKYKHFCSIDVLNDKLNKTVLYAWDISNDVMLQTALPSCEFTLVDVQKQWTKRYGVKQMSLSDAYKHVLYNLHLKDDDKLIENAHFASIDVLMLSRVIDFLKMDVKQLQAIPIEANILANKKANNTKVMDECLLKCQRLNEQLANSKDYNEQQKISDKLVKLKRSLASASRRNEKLDKLEVYDVKWW